MLVLLLLGVLMAVLALPLVHARSEAKSAQAELEAAKAALTNQDVAGANAHIEAAREHVRRADSDAHGFGAGVWGAMPVVGGAVDDSRHLINALSQTTKVAEIGAAIYPSAVGPKATLVQGERVDIPTLRKVVHQTAGIGSHLNKALHQLGEVSGSTPVVGGSIASARDTALAQLQPVSDSYSRTLPLLKATPAVLGADGPRTYLLAMLNPAELRFSGGGALSFTTIGFARGQAKFGRTVSVDQITQEESQAFLRWPGVPGNPFHITPNRVTNSTYSPYWSVSGEELLQAWNARYHQHLDGVIAVDLQALAALFAVTGPVEVPDHAPLTSDNLVQTLAGQYRTTTKEQRKAVNAALVPAFRTKFFEGGSIQEKLGSLLTSATNRNFATYFRDPAVQKRFRRAGLAGDLSATPNDYLGVFTQNTNGSKNDYFQQRSVASRVKLHDDGSAYVVVKTKVTNAAPPYTGPRPVPRNGYLTGYLGTAIGFFLPVGADLGPVTFNDKTLYPPTVTSSVKGIVNRPYFQRRTLLPAGHSTTVTMAYKVPHAAVRTAGGGLEYRFGIDPQDTVNPETLKLKVVWPQGWAPTTLPAGWVDDGSGGATLEGPVTSSLSYAVPLQKQ